DQRGPHDVEELDGNEKNPEGNGLVGPLDDVAHPIVSNEHGGCFTSVVPHRAGPSAQPIPSRMRTSRSTAPFSTASAACYRGLLYAAPAWLTLSNSMTTARWLSTPSNVFTATPRARMRPPPASIAGPARAAYSASRAASCTL